MKDTWSDRYEDRMNLLDMKYKKIFWEGDILCLYKNNEKSLTEHIKIHFMDNMILITGDYGVWIFGRMENPKSFFRGTYLQPGYWSEKLLSVSSWGGLKDDMINSDDLIEEIIKHMELYEVPENKRLIILEQLQYCDYLEAGDTATFDEVKSAFEYANVDIESMDIGEMIEYCREYTGPYLYICTVLQWIENKDELFKEIN